MNRRERRYGRMYLLPLLLALTGLALLPLEWVLRLSGFDAFADLKQTMLHNAIILFYPLVLLLLYAFRISPKAARVFSIVSLGLMIAQLVVIFYCTSKMPRPLMQWVPGYMLMSHIFALQQVRNAQNILLTCSDLSFVLSNLSAIFTCLVYAKVKTRSDLRNAEFDRRNPFPEKKSPVVSAADAATKVLPIPKEDTQ